MALRLSAPSLPRCLVPALTAALLAMSARACGPFFDEAIFVKSFGPDMPYNAFAAGRLGVLRDTWRVRHLVVAYRAMSGQPLSPQEQAEAVRANAFLLGDGSSVDAKPAGYIAWQTAAAAYAPPAAGKPADKQAEVLDSLPQRSLPGQSYTDFTDCLDDAFATATRTLAARAAAHGAQSAEVRAWAAAQQTVFANC